MGGIGKTTLARVVFHMVSNKFEGCCFLANVREVCAITRTIYSSNFE